MEHFNPANLSRTKASGKHGFDSAEWNMNKHLNVSLTWEKYGGKTHR